MSAIDFLASASGLIDDRSEREYRERFRPAVEQCLAMLLLMLFAPVMVFISALIWWCDGTPVCFGHYRVGRGGQLFRCLKFRTMAKDAERRLAELLARDPNARAEWDRDQKLVNDPRITSIGRFLRRTSLDELPQFINIVRGEMSLVGPRPITVCELDRYGSARWHYLSVTPGLTGLWQVSGRNELSYQERVDLDRYYVENRSLGLDFVILMRTVRVVLRKAGAR